MGPISDLSAGANPLVLELREWLQEDLGRRLGVDREAVGPHIRFKQLGLDSRGAVALMLALGARLGRTLSPTLIWEYPTIDALACHLAGVQRAPDAVPLEPARPVPPNDEPIAVIGMSCRFPGAPDPSAYWQLLRDGIDAIREIPADRWDAAAYYSPDPGAPGRMITRWGGFLEQVDRFDPQFFGISPREAAHIDPQQRLMLELTWEALEDAGVSVQRLQGSRTGVFFGTIWRDYADLRAEDLEAITLHSGTGQSDAIIANRVSYTFGLQGPSLAIDTACSSSLVALHLACQSLRSGESTLALAGGVNLILAPHAMIMLSKFGGLAPDGRCKAFDARANGFARGEGGGVVVLKRLSRALEEGDPIAGVILGSAVNNDGQSNGLTAPNPAAQESVLRDAYAHAGVDPRGVHYVEAHGTGTALGDPIEAGALGAVLGRGRDAEHPLRIGSVKTNFGHLESAAGIAGVIKVLLAMRYGALPPSLHFDRPNPHIPFEAYGLRVVDRLVPWPSGSGPALAGVSSFGWGGTNAHVVLSGLLEATHARAGELEAALARAGESEASASALAASGHAASAGPESPPGPVFVFSPQGGQWAGMGRDLLEQPVFRATLERCDRLLRRLGRGPLVSMVARGDSALDGADPERIQPVIFALQVAWAALLRDWGIEPAAVVGHSVGEIAAAHVAGALDLEDAVRVVHHYSRLMAHAGRSSRLALLEVPAEQVRTLLEGGWEDRLWLAGYNGPRATTVAGGLEHLEALMLEARQRGWMTHRIRIDAGAHSPHMDPVLAELRHCLADICPTRAEMPLFSSTTAAALAGPECDGAYWAQNMREPVRFSAAIDLLIDRGFETFLELGPHPVLSFGLMQQLELPDDTRARRRGRVLAVCRRDTDARGELLELAARLYTTGHPVRLERLYPRSLPHLVPGPQPLPAPLVPPTPATPLPHLVPLSAHTAAALSARARALSALLQARPDLELADLSYTAGARRSHLEHRLALVVTTREELDAQLEAFLSGAPMGAGSAGRCSPDPDGRVVYVFPGQGSQWPGMGRSLLDREPVFRQALKRCDAVIARETGWSVLEVLRSEDERALEAIDVVQPVLFAMAVGLAAWRRAHGLEPDAVVGHSMGEIAAAHVAGILTLEDAARVICRRSRLLRQVSGRGAMAVVDIPRAEALEQLAGYEDRLSIAVSSSPRSTVISGDPAALTELLTTLQAREVYCRTIRVDVASHSPQMDALRGPLLEALREVTPRLAAVPMISTVTGAPIEGPELDAAYWVRNLREPVLFSDAVQWLIARDHRVFLEISPHPVLVPALEEGLLHAGVSGLALPSLRRGEDERASLLATIGRRYVYGSDIQWSRLHPAGGRLVALPAYPWQRERHWLDQEPTRSATRRSTRRGHPLLGEGTSSSLHPGVRLWEQTLSPDALPWLEGHRVQGVVVLPATAFIEMALAAAEALSGSRPVALEQLSLKHMLALKKDAPQTVQLVVTDADAERVTFRISSRAAGEGTSAAWTLHATGRMVMASGSTVGDRAARPVLSSAGQRLEPADLYRSLAARGLEYSGAFQAIDQVWRTPDGVVARLELPEHAVDTSAFRVHPALSDAGLQLMGALLEQSGFAASTTVVPTAVGLVKHHRPPGASCWARATPGAHEPGTFVVDVALLEEDGEPLVELTGVRLQALEPAEGYAAGRLEGAFYRRQAVRRDLEPARSPGSAEGPWLVLTDRGGMGERLCARLEAAGGRCVRVGTGPRYLRRGVDAFEIDPDSPADFARLLTEAFPDGAPPRGAVHLWSLDATPPSHTTPESLEADQRLTTLPALHLAQATLTHAWRDVPRLWLVTRGAQPPYSSGAIPDVSQAALWGLARVIALEHPELRCTRIDLEGGGEATELEPPISELEPMIGELEPMVAELLAGDAEEEIMLRADGRYVARLEACPTGRLDLEPELPSRARREQEPCRLEVTRPGVLERLAWRSAPRRRPGADEVEIQVHAAGLNFLDVMKALGVYPGSERGPIALGCECAGRVVAVGSNVDIRPGAEVVALATHALASHVVVPASLVAAKPAGITLEQACAFPLVFMTAWYALYHLGRLQAGERVLIHSATGGTGLAAIQLARRAGAEVFATAGTPEKRALLRELGIEHVFDSRALTFAEEILRRTDGRGVDVVLNSLAGAAIEKGLEALAFDGRFIELGKRDIYAHRAMDLGAFKKHLSYSAVDLAGLAERAPRRYAELFQRVMAELAAGHLEPLPCKVYPASGVETAFRCMAQARHTGKLVISLDDPDLRITPADEVRLPLRDDGVYLITGGLGGLGLAAARWMAENGARQLLLMGRRPPREEALREIGALEAQGVRVAVAQADVSSRAQVAAALASVEAPLRGVLHAAGILEDQTLLNLDAGRFRRVMAPKVQGAWTVHTLTSDAPLDFFVVYSSAASMLGSPGQGNYAAANAALDALAYRRRAEGRPGLAINWGPFAEVGLAAAEAQRGGRLADRGLASLSVPEGHQALAMLLGHRVAQAGVMRLDVRQWCEFHPAAADAATWSALRAADAASPASSSSILDTLRALAPRERREALEAYAVDQLARVLRLDPARLDREATFGSLGLDSLLSLELRNRLEAGLGLKLSAAMLYAWPTVTRLAAFLGQKTGLLEAPQRAAGAPLATGAGAAGTPSAVAPGATGTPSAVAPGADDPRLERIRSLTQEQTEAALAARLAALEERL